MGGGTEALGGALAPPPLPPQALNNAISESAEAVCKNLRRIGALLLRGRDFNEWRRAFACSCPDISKAKSILRSSYMASPFYIICIIFI